MDTKASGEAGKRRINGKDFGRALEELLGLSARQCRIVFDHCDKDGSDSLDYAEV